MIRFTASNTLKYAVRREGMKEMAICARYFSQQVRRDSTPLELSLLEQESQRLRRDIESYKDHISSFDPSKKYRTDELEYYQFTQTNQTQAEILLEEVTKEMKALQNKLYKKEKELEVIMKSLDGYEQDDTIQSIKKGFNSLMKWVKPDTEILLYEAPVKDLVLFRTPEINTGIQTLQKNEVAFKQLEQETYDNYNNIRELSIAQNEPISLLLIDLGKEILILLNNARDVSKTIWKLYANVNGATLGDLSEIGTVEKAHETYVNLKDSAQKLARQIQTFKQATSPAEKIKTFTGMLNTVNSMKKDIDHILKIAGLLVVLYASYKLFRKKLQDAQSEVERKIEAQRAAVANIRSKIVEINSAMNYGIEEGKLVAEMLGKAVAIEKSTKDQIAALNRLKQLQEKIGKTLDEVQEAELQQLQKKLSAHAHTMVRLEKEMMDVDKKMSVLYEDYKVKNTLLKEQEEQGIPTSSVALEVVSNEMETVWGKVTAPVAKLLIEIDELLKRPSLEKAIAIQNKIKAMPEEIKAIPLVDPVPPAE